jgi:hypothetical protein
MKGSHLQNRFSAIAAASWLQTCGLGDSSSFVRCDLEILHEGVRYIEFGEARRPDVAKQKAQKMVRALRRLGYTVDIKPTNALAVEG